MIPQLSGRDPIGRPGDATATTSIVARAITKNDGTHWPSPARSHQPSLDRIACHGASAVDVAAQPERWRYYRLRLDDLAATLAVVRRGDRQPPPVAAAEARTLTGGR